MWTKFSVEVLLLCVLALIPLPGPGLFKITCCRDNSRIVRKIVQSKVLPVLEKYNVKLGQQCPFHPDRDIFAPQQSAKQQDRPSQWTCGVCGKSFYEEKFLDLHFEHRHRERINTAEDAVCLSNFCDIMRCDVLVALDGSLMFGNRVSSTDIEVWNEASARTAVAIASSSTRPKSSSAHGNLNRAAGTKTTTSSSSVNNKSHKTTTTTTSAQGRNSDFSRATCDRSRNRKSSKDGDEEDEEEDDEEEEEDDDANNQSCDPAEGEKEKDVVEESLPPLDRKQQRIAEMQRMKANCKKEELDGLRAKCQVLIRDCIGGLLINLSQQEFKEMEDELNRKICWYLSCDRYWEDGPPDRRAFPWLFLIVVATILSFGICLCYYIIWVLFESDDHKYFIANQSSNSQTYLHPLQQQQQQHHSPMHSRSYVSLHHPQQQNMLNNMMLADTPCNPTDCLDMNEVANVAQTGAGGVGGGGGAVAGQSEHYIYVTYPPELKRRLLESCYNRTTRL